MGKRLDPQEWAASTFEPWSRDGEWTPPSQDEWAVYLTHLGVAFALNCQTKDELVAFAARMAGEDILKPALDGLDAVKAQLRGVIEVIDAAESRLYIAAMVAALGSDDEIGRKAVA